MIRGLEISVPLTLLTSTGRGGALEVESISSGQRFNQLCLCNEASMNPKGEGLESCWVGECVEMWGEWHCSESVSFEPLPTYFALGFSSIWLFLSYILL